MSLLMQLNGSEPPKTFAEKYMYGVHSSYSSSSMLYSVSTDKTGALWDVEVGVRVKKLRGHTSFVNTCGPTRRGQQMLATASDDGTIKVLQCSCLLPLILCIECKTSRDDKLMCSSVHVHLAIYCLKLRDTVCLVTC